ncbi:GbsR/MarR family transcriptional regulator [Alkalihalobacillus sp. MEB130]|uniref:choline uptake/conversion transcriptional regulator CudC n=1 Tax=Alkalihalobacillus sp. MEB130 TaxID=2976704 RepID=UPI0028DEFDDA|nr:GbsR/MarR family transcriptional regulator [Alkalihalobacillus sp. MEB130]MDT8862930.1 GbsR/MarR family transcriptional regulator [Alkalihalobacillus sp. MEB130]
MYESDDKAKEQIDQAKMMVVDAIADTMDLYGVTRSVGVLYGTMYFEDEMTLDEMLEELGMSKPSMSTGVKKLQEYNIVKKTFQRGSRKHSFVAEKDFFRFFNNFFTRKWEREVSLNLDAIERAQKDLQGVLDDADVAEEMKDEARGVYDQLESSKPYYYWLKQLVDAMNSGKLFEMFPQDQKN